MRVWADKFENLPFTPQRVQSRCTETALKFIYNKISDATQTVAIPTIPMIKVSIVWVL